MLKPPSHIKHVPCSTAWQFLQNLNPLAGRSVDVRERPTFFYRGQFSDELDLLPSAFRKDRSLLLSGVWTPVPTLSTSAAQVQAEIDTLGAFFETADREGMTIPEDSQALRQSMRDRGEGLLKSKHQYLQVRWPWINVWSLMAIAQHHGIPTRLLDFTLHPHVACYFAAIGALEIMEKREFSGTPEKCRMAVWRFESESFRQDTGADDFRKEGETGLVALSIPRSTDANLHAQKGIFLTRYEAQIRPQEEALRDPYYPPPNPEGLDPRLAPLHLVATLPWSEAASLLMLLRRHGIDGATAFPGHDGVARSLLERRFLPTPERWLKSASFSAMSDHLLG